MDLATEILTRNERLKTDTSGHWNALWQDIKDLVRPGTSDFNRTRFAGAPNTDRIFDGTAPWALEQFASGLHSYLTSPTERWFQLGSANPKIRENEEVLAHCERISDEIYAAYSLPQSNHNQSLHESFLDVGGFGILNICQEWSDKINAPVFRAFPLASYRVLENDEGTVDTVYRDVEYTTRQAKQRWGEKLPKAIRESQDTEKRWKFVHCVYPRSDKDRNGRLDGKGMPFASVWVSEDCKEVVWEGGYDSLPYHVARWEKIAGENYGRSPAMTCLPDIRMINEMAKVVISAAQLTIRPPMQLPNDNFLTPLDMTPGALNYRQDDDRKAEPLMTGARPDIGEEMVAKRAEHISRCFYAELMMLKWKNERQTATEIMERRDDMLRQMAPMLGRLQSELLGPMLKRTYQLLLKRGMLPPHPDILNGEKLEITYISPAAIAQRGSKMNELTRWLQGDILPLSQIDPGVLDAVNLEKLPFISARLRNVTREAVRSPEEVAERKQQKQAAAALSQMAEVGGQAAGALKDVSVAAKNAPSLVGI
jgi:hypothetical protein